MNLALWHMSSTSSELRPVVAPGDTSLVEIRSLYSMVSVGSERLVATGRAARASATLDAPYVEGSFEFPIKYGYSLVGRDQAGRLLHALHPHQSVAFVRDADVHVLPESMPAQRGTLLSNMETALTASWDARLSKSHDALVCGFGNVGALTALTLRLQYQINPLIVESDAWRREKAESVGFEAISPDRYNGMHPRLFDASSSAAGLQFCIDHCATDGIVVALSWFGVDRVSLDLGAAFHRNRVQLVSSQVSTIPAHVAGRETSTSRKALAASLLTDTVFDELITNTVAFADAPAFFDGLRQNRQEDGLTWVIAY